MHLLKKYGDIFQWTKFECDRTTLAEHMIDTNDARPIKQRQYRLTQAAKEEIDRQIDSTLNGGIIEESKIICSSRRMGNSFSIL